MGNRRKSIILDRILVTRLLQKPSLLCGIRITLVASNSLMIWILLFISFHTSIANANDVEHGQSNTVFFVLGESRI